MIATALNLSDTTSAPVITLRQRIVDALTKPTSSAEVRSCTAHTQADLASVERDRARAEAKAVDPLASEDEANEGKRVHDSLRFDLERLNSSLSHLNQRLAAVTRDEDQAARRTQYSAAVKVRDEAAEALRKVYPEAVAAIRNVLVQIAEAEAAVLAANQKKPDDAEHIIGAEAKATGKPVNVAGEYSLATGVRLPTRFGSVEWPVW